MTGLIFTYLLTGVGAVAGLFRPYYGFLAYVAFAILKPESLWYWSVPEANFSRIVGVCLLIGWVFQGLGTWHLGKGFVIVGTLLLFCLWTILSASMAPNADVAWPAVEALAKIVLPFLVAVSMIDSVQKLKHLAWVIVLCEGYVAVEMNLSYLNGFNRLQEVGFGGMDNNCNGIAMVTCMGLAFFLALSSPRIWQKAIAIVFFLAMAHANLIAFSRGAMLAMIITGAVTFFLIPKKPVHYLAFALVILVLLRLAGPEVQARFLTTFASDEERDGSAELRIKHWNACLDSIQQRPIVGVGPDHWRFTCADYGLPSMEAHSTWLQVAAEVGVPAAACLLAFYVLAAYLLWPIAQQRTIVPDPWLHVIARMVISAIAGFLPSAQFVTLDGLEVPYYIVALGVGALKLMAVYQASAEARGFRSDYLPVEQPAIVG